MHGHPSHRPGNGSSSTPRHAKPRTEMERREAPGSWAAPRGRMLPPARAPGAARATEDFLAETVCFGRAAPPGAPPRSAAPAVDRRKLLRPHPPRRIAVSARRLASKRDEAPKAPLDGQCQAQTKLRCRLFQVLGVRPFFSPCRTKMTLAADVLPRPTAFTPE
jgi:hypothetical protein